MFQNFSVKPKLSLLTSELCNGVVAVDKSIKEEVYHKLENTENVKPQTVRIVTGTTIYDENYLGFYTMAIDDTSRYDNIDCIYSGKLPKYDNEIVISGKYAKKYGYKKGDTIKMVFGDKEYDYLITGFMQSTNNEGREAIMTEEAFSHLYDLELINMSAIWFDTEKDGQARPIIDALKEEYGEKIGATIVFDEIIESQIGTFVGIANLMLIVISAITAAVIILVLYLLMKTIIFDRRYEYGILKALGYKSKDLIIQNVLSFLPTIVIGTVIGTIISSISATPYIGLMMRSFGIMKCTMDLPFYYPILTVIFIVVLAVLAAVLMSLKIRKVEPYKLLIGE
jgi:ABC-type lipoprotein release transport system permease subunit